MSLVTHPGKNAMDRYWKTYPRASSPTASIAVIDEMELPEIAPRVAKPLPQGESHAKVAKPKIANADGGIVAIES
ncbi:hypothetical protein QFC20_004027 [Naganishia adeliensis]|uniref:Uncharacterized protein n=1 Tax=Naganishia adeliensis TaxID=92952 RepID=A0ACC2W6K3_9TREE|nr:hypothetical protein QFC20_004027 [Naganishia adeliensis]